MTAVNQNNSLAASLLVGRRSELYQLRAALRRRES